MSDRRPQQPLALVFTDIEGSSHLWEKHGVNFLEALETHDALLTETCREFGGKVVKNEGDAFFLVFEEPRSALQFALQAQQLLQEYDWTQRVPAMLRVRIGLHYGLTHEREGDYFGSEVNRAARICSAGHGSQILASEELLANCGDTDSSIRITDLARHRLRGLSEPQHLYQLTLGHWPQQEWPILRTLDDVPTNLPAQVTSFVGREDDLVRVAGLLADPQVRLLTLTGPGGGGKSRLAQEAAAQALEQFPDGVFWISLAEYSTIESVPTAILDALKLQPQAGQSPAAIIATHARDRQLLLVLDNFEHLIEAADFLAELLRQSSDIRLLVTSREVLHLEGEQLIDVLPLALPEPPISYQTLSHYESVHLFLHRARAVSADFAITEENAAAIAEICLRLDGIPLALELAAAWVRVYPPLHILQRLGGRSQVLTSRVRGVVERQRTVRDTINWSYQMLSAEEQRVLRRLSVFRGGFFLEAAEAVCGPTTIENVMTLHDKSLLCSKEALGQRRFHLLETVREFGEEKLVEAGEEKETRSSHLDYYAAWADGVEYHRKAVAAMGDYWPLVRLEEANVEQAVRQVPQHEDTEVTICLFSLLFSELAAGPSSAERLLPLLSDVLAQVSGHEGENWPAVAAYVRLACYFHSWRYEEGLGHAEEAFALADASGDDRFRYTCAVWASALAANADRRQCSRWTNELARWAATQVDQVFVAVRLWQTGNYQEALQLVERALSETEDERDPLCRFRAISHAMVVYLGTMEYRKGLPYVAELVHLVKGPLSSDVGTIQYGWQAAIPVVARAGKVAEATRLAREQVALLDTLEPGLRATRLVGFLNYCNWANLWGVAGELADQYLSPWPTADLPANQVAAMAGTMVEIYSRKGDREQALVAATPLLHDEWRCDEEGDYAGGARLKSVAEMLRVCDKLAEAVQVTVVAARLQSPWPFRKLLCHELLELLAAEIPDEAYAAAKVHGESMTGAQALAVARRASGV